MAFRQISATTNVLATKKTPHPDICLADVCTQNSATFFSQPHLWYKYILLGEADRRGSYRTLVFAVEGYRVIDIAGVSPTKTSPPRIHRHELHI